MQYIDQNIENGVASVDDYILKANCILNTHSEKEYIIAALELIEKAKALDSGRLIVTKTEIVAAMRLGDQANALNLLENYLQELSLLLSNDLNYQETANEIIWAQRMKIVVSEL